MVMVTSAFSLTQLKVIVHAIVHARGFGTTAEFKTIPFLNEIERFLALLSNFFNIAMAMKILFIFLMILFFG